MRIPPFMAYTYAYIWCSMIALIDGSDPPEPPPTPVTFDSRIRSIRAKSTRGWRPVYTTPDIWRRFARCNCAVRCDSDRALAMNGMGPWPWMEYAMTMNGIRHDHEWNTPWPWMECAIAISGAISRGYIGGEF